MSATVTIPVADKCEYSDCHRDALNAFVVTGDVGMDGIAVYCEQCSKSFADSKDSHTAISQVNQ